MNDDNPYQAPETDVVKNIEQHEEFDFPPLNPFISIWTKPRATIQQIVRKDPTYLVLLLASLNGISRALDRASTKSLGDKLDLPILLISSIIGGVVGGLIMFYLFSALISWTGSWLGGKGNMTNIRAAYAWSTFPIAVSLILIPPELIIFGKEFFTLETPAIDGSPQLQYLLYGFGILELILGIWSLVLFFKCIGQVQGFSSWKALANMILAVLVLIIPIAVIGFGAAFFFA